MHRSDTNVWMQTLAEPKFGLNITPSHLMLGYRASAPDNTSCPKTDHLLYLVPAPPTQPKDDHSNQLCYQEHPAPLTHPVQGVPYYWLWSQSLNTAITIRALCNCASLLGSTVWEWSLQWFPTQLRFMTTLHCYATLHTAKQQTHPVVIVTYQRSQRKWLPKQ